MSIENHHLQKSKDSNLRQRKYLVFSLNGEDYGVLLSDVTEVIGVPQFTEIPGAPGYFLGLVNLRGQVISAVDLKSKIGLGQGDIQSRRPALIITQVEGVSLGCRVDSIKEVLTIEEEKIDRTLDVQVSGNPDLIQGIARFKERSMILILDIRRSVDVSSLVHLRAS